MTRWFCLTLAQFMKNSTSKGSKLIHQLNSKLVGIVIATILFILYALITVYNFDFKDTGESYSLTQSYEKYYGIEDWNLSKHALVDMDSDGIQDMITFTNCAFLTKTNESEIPEEMKCTEPGMSPIGFPNGDNNVGQLLVSKNQFKYTLLRKSYLTQSTNNKWKFYDLNGFQVKTFELGSEGLFHETKSTISDKIDAIYYQSTHFGVMMIIVTMSVFFH